MVAGGVVGVGWLGVARLALASGVSAEIALSTTRARVGERVGIKLSVTSTTGDPPEPEFPDALDASFEVVRSETAYGSSAVLQNGQLVRSATRSLSAVLLPNKAGTYRLSFSVPVAAGSSKTVRSNEIELEILEGDAPEPEPEPEQPETGSNRPTRAKGDVFLWASVDKQVAYVGEQVTYRLDVYERRQFLNMHLRKTPTFTDFFTEDLSERDETSLQEVDGITYRVRPGIARALFPQKAGRLPIGPAEVAIGLRRREESQTLEVEVLPLPAEGRPAGFSPNNVGRYAIAASVDRDDLRPGEPFTLTVTIEGTGNIGVIDPGPWPALPGARRYDPKVETHRRSGERVGGQRSYKFLVIPERTGKLVIPAHELHFFDPEQKAYETVRTEPIELRVGDEGDESEAVVAHDDTHDDLPTEPLADVIVADTVPRREPRERWLTPERWTVGMGAVPIFAALGLGAGAAWRRFGPDERARERAMARARRRELSERARATIASGEGFHAALAQLLQSVAVGRAGPDGVGLPRPELLRLLEQRGVDPEICRKLEDLLDRCDAARFGARRGTADERQALLDDALAVIDDARLVGGGVR